jgi:hypothetical protein
MNKSNQRGAARPILALSLCLIALPALFPPPAAARRNQSNLTRADFARATPCPATGKTGQPCPGYGIGYAIPLCAGGPDDISNMQWQRLEEAQEKDRRDRQLCKMESRETDR